VVALAYYAEKCQVSCSVVSEFDNDDPFFIALFQEIFNNSNEYAKT
jgi:hypothetical protein